MTESDIVNPDTVEGENIPNSEDVFTLLDSSDPTLREVACDVSVEEVKPENAELQKLIDKMLMTVSKHPNGFGLAAPQVGVPKKISVIRHPRRGTYHVLINPVIIAANGKKQSTEGCLSTPGKYFRVKRATNITLVTVNRNGDAIRLKVNDPLLARIIQHEVDHLNGKMLIDTHPPLN